jgi:competence protein ComEC
MPGMSEPQRRDTLKIVPNEYYHPLVIVLLAVVAGILADRFSPLPFWTGWSVATVGLLVWCVLFRQGKTTYANFALGIAIVAIAGAWHHACWYLFPANDLGRYARERGQPVCAELIVRSGPRPMPPPATNPMQIRESGERWRLTADAVALRNGATWQPVSGQTTVSVEGERPDVHIGDRVRCFATLSAAPRAHNPGQRDWAAYQRTSRVRCRLTIESLDSLSVIERGSPWNFWRLLERVREHGHAMFERYLDPQQADLASAVLLGLREEMDNSRVDAFFMTGTIHILCISGLHVGILAFAMFWIIRRTPLPRTWAVWLIAVTIVLYAMMVDAQPSVIRATVLVLIACLAYQSGGEVLSVNALAAAALVVLAFNPCDLFSIGAQLSFLCVATLIWYAPGRPHIEILEEERTKRTLHRLIVQNLSWPWRQWYRFHGAVRGLLMAGVVVYLLTLPLVLARFHTLCPIALIINVFVIPWMSICVQSGLGVLLLGTICPPLAWLCGFICNISFWLTERLIDWAQHVPHWWLPGPADWWLWGWYGGWGFFWAFPQWRPSRPYRILLLCGWVGIGLLPHFWPHDPDRLDCTFLSIGHGCAVVLELPSGETMLYDAGSMGNPTAGSRTIAECLWDRGITRIDSVVLSHPDLDHFNALPDLMHKISVGKIFVSPIMFEKETYTVQTLRTSIEEQAIPVREVREGDRLVDKNGCTIDVLQCHLEQGKERTNAGSLVLSITHRGRQILLPGDLEGSGLDALLLRQPRHVDVLLAPHHGSKKSNSPELADWCRPDFVVFSGNGHWSTPELEATYHAVGAKVLHTYAVGAVDVQIDAGGIRVLPFLQPSRLP